MLSESAIPFIHLAKKFRDHEIHATSRISFTRDTWLTPPPGAPVGGNLKRPYHHLSSSGCVPLSNSISRFGFRVAGEAKEEEEGRRDSDLIAPHRLSPSLRSSCSSFGQFIWPAPPPPPLPHRSASQIGLKVSQRRPMTATLPVTQPEESGWQLFQRSHTIHVLNSIY